MQPGIARGYVTSTDSLHEARRKTPASQHRMMVEVLNYNDVVMCVAHGNKNSHAGCRLVVGSRGIDLLICVAHRFVRKTHSHVCSHREVLG